LQRRKEKEMWRERRKRKRCGVINFEDVNYQQNSHTTAGQYFSCGGVQGF
jgi:hypothetical protein